MQTIFLDPASGAQAAMPVMPESHQVTLGRAVTNLDMAEAGQVNLPGLKALFNEQQEFLLPTSARSYTAAGWDGDAWGVVEQLAAWSEAGTVLRYIVTGTPVNYPVLLAPVQVRQEGGAGDLTVTVTLRQYRELEAETVEKAETGNSGRAARRGTQAEKTYTVVSGDTLWGIARRYYGDGSLAWKLAGYNGIKNANLIYLGQAVAIPDKGLL